MPAAPATDIAPPALQPRYCTFVQPLHPLVEEIFGAPREGGDTVGDGLEALRTRCRYRARPGHNGFDALLARPRLADGRLEVNCIDMICILVSQLRRAGMDDDGAYVALAGISGFLQHHAWALVRHPAGFLWIDPAVLKPVVLAGRDILRRHDVYAVFNDSRLLFAADEKRRLLAGDAA